MPPLPAAPKWETHPIEQKLARGKFWWSRVSVNGADLWAVLDTASHDLLIPDAEACTQCADRAANPDSSNGARAEPKHFSIETVHVRQGDGTVCTSEQTCARAPVHWIVSAERLGYAVRGVGPSEQTSAALPFVGVGLPLAGNRGRMWYHPNPVNHARSACVRMLLKPAIEHGHKHSLPCVRVTQCAVNGGAPAPVSSDLGAAMLDTGTPGCVIPHEWAPALAKRLGAPKGDTVACGTDVVAHIGPELQVALKSPFFGGTADSMHRRYGVCAIIGSESMRGFGVEFYYKEGIVRWTPLKL